MRVLYLAMSPDGQSIVTGAGDETLRFWNVFPDLEAVWGSILVPVLCTLPTKIFARQTEIHTYISIDICMHTYIHYICTLYS